MVRDVMLEIFLKTEVIVSVRVVFVNIQGAREE
jgi:hypothetical protein